MQNRGVIHFRGREWQMNQAFHGSPVALRATATDGQWDVYFGVHRIASIDLRAQNESR